MRFLWYELGQVVNGRWWRLLSIAANGNAWLLASYRIERGLYLTFGRAYSALRPLGLPWFMLVRLMGGTHEIHYRAKIGRGLRVLHGAGGVVVSAHVVAGERLTLTGGNVLGLRSGHTGLFTLGDDVTVSANACILGPISVPDRVNVGAGAVLLHPCRSGDVMIGVPAKPQCKAPVFAARHGLTSFLGADSYAARGADRLVAKHGRSAPVRRSGPTRASRALVRRSRTNMSRARGTVLESGEAM